MANELVHTIIDRVGAPILISVFAILFVAESVSLLRQRMVNRKTRLATNVLLSIPGFVVLRLVLLPILVWLAIKNESWQFGILNWIDLPFYVQAIVGFLLLDYFIYTWHVLNHRMPLLWRFHLVHHTDLDLDVSTAIRFHFGELLGAVIFRGAIVLCLGVSPEIVLIYEIAFEAATQFHHSNWKLPFQLETVLNKVIVTPRMHGIHHSQIRNETDSNYSVIFSFWDRIHKTINLSIYQNEIKIGVPAYHNASEQSVWFLTKLPFTRPRGWTKSIPARGGSGARSLLKP